MKPQTTIADLSQKRQLELYLELAQLGVLMTSVADLFPTEIRQAAKRLSDWRCIEELGISPGTIERYERASKALEHALESGKVEMDPMVEWVLMDGIRGAENTMAAERLRFVSDELKQIRKKYRKDKHNTELLERGKYYSLVAKFVERHFILYGGGTVATDDSINQQSARKAGDLPKPSKWSDLTLKFNSLETLEIKNVGSQPITRHFAGLGFAHKRTGKPTLLWTLLQVLAYQGGELYSDHPLLNKESNTKIDTEQKLTRLRKELRKNFGLTENPIPWKKRERCYQCSFTLKMDKHIQQFLRNQHVSHPKSIDDTHSVLSAFPDSEF